METVITTNATIFQAFHWYYPADGSLWKKLTQEAQELREAGITMVWLPPAYKDDLGPLGAGYAVYDLYDLGEFDQHGSVRTKYGTLAEYICCIEELRKQGLKVMVDVVFHHRYGGDEKEKVHIQEFHDHDRADKKGEPYELDVLSKFTFPGRNGKYSRFIWDFSCFTGIGTPTDSPLEHRYYNILNEYGNNWDQVPNYGFGNFDHLTGAEVEMRNPAVQQELVDWGIWLHDIVPYQGVRFDGLIDMNTNYIKSWVGHIKRKAGPDLFTIGEYWSARLDELSGYITKTEGQIPLFDVPLHYNFAKASRTDASFDMRSIWHDTLVLHHPLIAVSFVDHHFTQPLQRLESFVDYWFQPLAYAIILLREQGTPCVFYPSYFGAQYEAQGADGGHYTVDLAETSGLKKMMYARKSLAYGFQRDYIDHPNVIGWTREGIDELKNSGCAVLLSNGAAGNKYMEIGQRHAGQRFIDLLGYHQEEVEINAEGWGNFFVHDRSISIWVLKV